jgi:hypothetical protein
MRNLGSLMLIGLIGLAGCTDDNSSIFISHVGIFEFEDEGGCSVAEDTYLTRSRFNVAFAENSYIMPAVIVSQLVRREVATTAEPNGVTIESADVQILNEAGQSLTPEYSVVSSGGVYIPPSPVGETSRRVVSFPVIPPPVTQLLQDLVRTTGPQTIVVSMRALGRTTGGTELESALFTFGIELVDLPGSVVCDSVETREDYPMINCISGQDGVPYLVTCI